MKSILLIFLLLVSLSIKSQIIQDFSYQGSNYLIPVRLTTYEYKYLIEDDNQNYFTLLNSDGSLFKNISIPPGPGSSPTHSGPFSIFSSVFDNDSSTIEYMVTYHWDSSANFRKQCTEVIREDGTVLLNETDAHYPDEWDPSFSNSPLIYKTSEGAKLKLEYSFAKSSSIYKTTIFSLPGNLPTGTSNDLFFKNNSLCLFPNPNNGIFSIKLSDKQEIVKIELYSSDGKLIKIIQSQENPIKVSTDNLQNGIYLLKIFNNYSNPKTEKVIIIK